MRFNANELKSKPRKEHPMVAQLRAYIEENERTADHQRPKVFGRSDWPLKRWFELLKIDVNADVPSGAPSWLTLRLCDSVFCPFA